MGFSLGDIAKSAVSAFTGGGGEGGQQDSVTRNTPWEPLQPYYQDIASQAQGLYNSGGPNYYPNQTYVPFSAQSQAAMQLGQNRALFGSQFDQPAGNVAMQNMQGNSPYTMAGVGALGMAGLGAGQLNATAQGGYLNSNPYLDQAFNAAARGLNTQYNNQVMPGINATFGSGGRTGSNAHQQSIDMANTNYGNAVGDMAAQIYGGNYQAERDRQMGASSALGNLGMGIASGYGGLGSQNFAQQMGGAALGQNLAQNDWQNIGMLGGIGQQVEGKAGQMLGDYQDRFNFYQQRPEANLQQYAQLIGGLGSGFGTSNTNVDNQNGSALGNLIGQFGRNYAQSQFGG